MFNNVLIGVNDAEGGRDAIALGKMLVARDGALTLGHVYHQEPPGPWRMADVRVTEDRERAPELLERAGSEAGVRAHTRWIGAPSVGRGLHEMAEMIGADLLVVGSSRRGLLGRTALKDDTRASLNGAPCAVAIAPAGYSQHPPLMREVGVGYDGSPESEHALRIARKLATEQRSKLSVFEAVSLPANAYVFAGIAPGDKAYEQLVADARRRVAALDGVEPHAAYGQPAEELALYSASLDLLVIGSRSYGPIGRLVHGSIAQHLARTARCPLLILTRAARKKSTSVVSETRRDTVSAVS